VITCAPSGTFEARADNFPTGLTGTLGVRILDDAGATTTSRVTAGITENPTGSGSYIVTLTAPAIGGSYSVFWDTGTVSPSTTASEQLSVAGNQIVSTGATVGGSFTYAGTLAGQAITTARDKVRLELGDTDPTAILFYDEEIDVYLATRGQAVLITAADLCDAAATKFARAITFQTDGQTFKRETLVTAFQQRAKDLRARASGIGSFPSTRQDGYSVDIASDEAAAGGSGTANFNPRQRYEIVGGLDRLP
jgi:hypothetical protein